jgi:hypothetical protein
MPKWTLTKHEGAIEVSSWELPGELSEQQVEDIVRRLVCRSLSDDEIINSSVDGPHRYVLRDRNDDPKVIHMGEKPYFIAQLID